MQRSKLLWLVASTWLLCACTPSESRVARNVPGADRSLQGCIASAGYIWSSVRGDCIRVFEAGLAFTPEPSTHEAVHLAYLVLGVASDGIIQEAELYLPQRSQPVQLTLQHNPEGDTRPILFVNTQEGIRIVRVKDEHILEASGERFRRQSPPEDLLFQLR